MYQWLVHHYSVESDEQDELGKLLDKVLDGEWNKESEQETSISIEAEHQEGADDKVQDEGA